MYSVINNKTLEIQGNLKRIHKIKTKKIENLL